jgi:RNA polymerase sigma-70 factor, ECF subfamily
MQQAQSVGGSSPEAMREVRAAQAGDLIATRALFERLQRPVMAYCLVATKGDRDAALDLVQDTFGRAFKALPGLTEPEAFRGWVFTIASNLVRSRGATESRRREVLEGFALETLQDSSQAEEPAMREQRIARVRELVDAVEDEKMRTIAHAHYVEGQKTRDIATSLGMPHGTVTVKLMRFRDGMKRALCAAVVSGEFP